MFKSFKSFKPSKSMSNGSFKSVANLYPVTEGIIAINRVTTLFVPGNFRWIRTPVVFSSVEPFKDRRVKFRRDPEIDVRPLHRARAPFCDRIRLAQNHELSRVRYSEGNLPFTRYLPALHQTECIPVPVLPLLQVSDLDADVTDSAQRNDFSLRFVSYRIPSDRKLHRVAIGIQNKE